MAKISKAEYDETFEDLKGLLKRGETIYCVLRSVSRSGMSRRIDIYVMRRGYPVYLSYRVARLLGWTCKGNGDGIRVDGCGMDMGFHLVYCLGRTLFPNGIRLRKGEWHNNIPVGAKYDGGYAFKYQWI